MDGVFQHLTFNVAGGSVTKTTIDGRAVYVADAVLLTHDVHEGSNGPLYYPDTDLSKNPASWDGVPIIAKGHPMKDGKPVLALNNKAVIEEVGVGYIKDTVYNDKLKTKMVFDVEKTKKVDPRIAIALEANQSFEISTGLEHLIELTSGTFNGVKYKGKAVDYKPDHVAVLMEGEGACGKKKGCGCNVPTVNKALTVNDASFGRIMSGVRQAMEEKFGYVYIRDVYDGFFVYQKGYSNTDPLLMRKYSVNKEGKVTIADGDPVTVNWVTEYRTADGSFVGNCSPQKENDVDKTQIVNELISKGGWVEDERAWLMSLNDGQLKKMHSTLTVNTPNPNPDPTPKPGVGGTTTNPNPQQGNGSRTLEQELAGMNPRYRAIVTNAMKQDDSVRKQYIATINEATKTADVNFSEKWLTDQDTDTLRLMAHIAGVGTTTTNGSSYSGGGGSFLGQATVPNSAVTNNNTKVVQPLVPRSVMEEVGKK
jgi:hypothetical protein